MPKKTKNGADQRMECPHCGGHVHFVRRVMYFTCCDCKAKLWGSGEEHNIPTPVRRWRLFREKKVEE